MNKFHFYILCALLTSVLAHVTSDLTSCAWYFFAFIFFVFAFVYTLKKEDLDI